MLDRHCHILYGLDDGAVDLEESVAMLRAARAAGVTDIVATPHVLDASFDFLLACKRKEELKDHACKIGITLRLGCEVFWYALSGLTPEMLSQCRIENTDSILVEFNLHSELPRDMMKGIFSLQQAGLEVIIAHPERYDCVKKDSSTAQQWLDMGCTLQLDANVLLLPILSPTRRCAYEMLKRGMYQYAASDAHCVRDYERFARSIELIKRKYGGLAI